MKIRPVGAELFHADGRTGMMKLTVTFRNVRNANKTATESNFLHILKWISQVTNN